MDPLVQGVKFNFLSQLPLVATKLVRVVTFLLSLCLMYIAYFAVVSKMHYIDCIDMLCTIGIS